MAARIEELRSDGSVVDLELRLSPADRLKSITALKAKKRVPAEEELEPEPIIDDDDEEEGGEDTPVPRSRKWSSSQAMPEARKGFRLTIANVSFLLMVAIPVVATTIYLVFFAAPQYVSEFKFAVRQQEQMPLADSAQPAAAAGARLSALSMLSDNFIIVDYLQSRDALEELAQSVDFDKIYQTDKADWLSRLGPNPSIEQKVSYWRWRLSTSFDMSTGIATVEVKAFTPEDAQKVAQTLLSSAERLINTMQDRARHDAIKFFEDQVQIAEDRLNTARAAVRTYRNEQQIVSPSTTGESIFTTINKMEQERVTLKSQLSAMERFMDDTAPSLRVMRSRLTAVEEQITNLRSQVGSKTGRDGTLLSGIIASFEELEQNRIFAEKSYESAVSSLEMARANAAMKHTYMAMFIKPKVAETATYPKKLEDIFLVGLAALFIWFVSLMAIYAVRDHAL